MTTPISERPHPSDVTPEEKETTKRRLLLGLAVAVVLNIGFITGGSMIAAYLTRVFHPFFYPTTKTVYVELQSPPSPSPAASPLPKPSPKGR